MRNNLKRELDALVTQMHSAGVSYADALRQFKRRYLIEVLAHHKGNQCKAAEELGMHRNTLSRTLAELELDTAQIRTGMRRPPVSERPRPQPVAAPLARVR
jgi:DNA-binding NtrC family response regulator